MDLGAVQVCSFLTHKIFHLKTEWALLQTTIMKEARAIKPDSRDRQKSSLRTEITAFFHTIFSSAPYPKSYFHS